MKSKPDLVSAAEACSILGVKAQTLYSYVSRGLISVQLAKDRRESLYPRSQIEALRARSHARSGHGPTAASAMRFGDPILESAITLIQDHEIYYRGYALIHLIEDGLNFEAVAELLWSGVIARTGTIWTVDTKNVSKGSPNTDDPASAIGRMFQFGTAEHAFHDDRSSEESLDLAVERARTLIKQAAKSLSGCKKARPSSSIAELLATAIGRDAAFAIPSLNHALVCSADHELNASTFATRIAASTGADLYSCFAAGLGAFSGPRHGVSPIYAYQFMEGSFRTKSPKQTIAAALRCKKMIPGFGHPLYLEAGDPRAHILISSLRGLRSHLAKDGQARLLQVEDFLVCAAESRLGFPNLDLGLAALVWVLGLPGAWSAGLFAMGRMAGWTAHILEQRQQEFLLRPRARYTGRTPVERPYF